MKTSIGITPKNLLEVSKVLNVLLADEHILYIKTRKAHWNIEGKDFLTMHNFFEDQYKQIETIIDELAERIRTIGHYAVGSLTEFLELTHLSEKSNSKTDSATFMKILLEDHESIIIHIREQLDKVGEDLKDEGTNDFLTGLLKAHEKMAWMLRAHL
ncbi:Dps family protein [Pedobacter flavus]|uniref:DNA starvation/stationary phase protection protein n=1 Tax=Pedobacter flavus TaxID=3113906 RepID=A0ABU7H3L4_9SPHI|nr:DNA starvation/stationary phase protection protein [Pedobacter sp. VNH31]MEE1885920.1 DNA starvation/stationary phase protection protein [Pedobacter sp. VNH31]